MVTELKDQEDGGNQRKRELEFQFDAGCLLLRAQDRRPLWRIRARDEVRREQAAEEHHFGSQEQDETEHRIAQLSLRVGWRVGCHNGLSLTCFLGLAA
jgi:hypothetical protein